MNAKLSAHFRTLYRHVVTPNCDPEGIKLHRRKDGHHTFTTGRSPRCSVLNETFPARRLDRRDQMTCRLNRPILIPYVFVSVFSCLSYVQHYSSTGTRRGCSRPVLSYSTQDKINNIKLNKKQKV